MNETTIDALTSNEQKVLEYVRAHPGQTYQEIGAGLGLRDSTATAIMCRLWQKDAVDRAGVGITTSGRRAARYFARVVS